MIERLQRKSEKADLIQLDFLVYFIKANKKNPDVVDEKLTIGYLQVNMLGGADVTAITLRAVFVLHLLNPAVF